LRKGSARWNEIGGLLELGYSVPFISHSRRFFRLRGDHFAVREAPLAERQPILSRESPHGGECFGPERGGNHNAADMVLFYKAGQLLQAAEHQMTIDPLEMQGGFVINESDNVPSVKAAGIAEAD